jgi:hypothetical protein
MPTLCILAKRYLCIPASSASCERSFSNLKLTATDLRNNLCAEKVATLISYKGLLKKKLVEHEDADEQPSQKRIRQE